MPGPSHPHGGSLGGLERRSFLKLCAAAAATLGLPSTAAAAIAEAVSNKQRPSVIWLHFQECTGCTETLLRPTHPDVAELLLDLVSVDYHETLFAAAGRQAEAALHAAIEEHKGKYVCVVEGAIPLAHGGVFCKIGNETAVNLLQNVGSNAGAVIAIGSCASWGGVAAAPPNPTHAVGAGEVLENKAVVTIPGCPANPYNFLSTVLHYLTFGRLPALDELGRPLFAYGRTIHEHCPRRPHFDAGRFVEAFGDEGSRLGYCLYKLGCKGPETHANCPTNHFCEVPGAWPIGVGHPCFGCTEKHLAFTKPQFTLATIERPTPPDTYPPVTADRGGAGPIATGVGGLVVGALAGAGIAVSRKVSRSGGSEDKES